MALNIKRLYSGGLITNYYCSSSCRHCVYCSSPSWEKHYMTKNTANTIFKKISKMGCTSMHIGGGEPLLNPNALYDVLDCAIDNGIYIDYIETNSSWYKDEDSCVKVLMELIKRNVNTLLISIDPYHNEFIPLYKVESLIKVCKKTNMGTFLWRSEFYDDINAFDNKTTHTMQEYNQMYGDDYIVKLANRYGLNLRGRALKTYKSYMKEYTLDEILSASKPCSELNEVNHFHIDLYGNYVPQSCVGLSIQIDDLGKSISNENYPIINILASYGVKELLPYAKGFGFVPEKSYVSKCELCHEIRYYLTVDKNIESIELKPLGYYKYI